MSKDIVINSGIFPVIMSIQDKDINGKYSKVYHIPRSINLLYLENIKDNCEKDLLRKYANAEKFNDNIIIIYFAYIKEGWLIHIKSMTMIKPRWWTKTHKGLYCLLERIFMKKGVKEVKEKIRTVTEDTKYIQHH